MPRTTSLLVAPPAALPARAHRATWRLLLVSMRPEQWTKNLLVFAGLLFGGRALEVDAVIAAVAVFAIFCALSGAGYLANDLADRRADREHPLKRLRPIASGALRPAPAAVAAGVSAVSAIAAAASMSAALGLVAVAYVSLLLAYSAGIKHVVILDVLAIAAGFVLRAAAGALAVAVPISPWLLVCTTLLALFLALSKRRHELTLLEAGAGRHRPILREYSPYLLDQMIAVVTASTVIAYTVYATGGGTAARAGSGGLAFTVPFVLYGIFRYLYLVHRKDGGGSPAELLVTDRPLLACVAAWGATISIVLYGG